MYLIFNDMKVYIFVILDKKHCINSYTVDSSLLYTLNDISMTSFVY